MRSVKQRKKGGRRRRYGPRKARDFKAMDNFEVPAPQLIRDLITISLSPRPYPVFVKYRVFSRREQGPLCPSSKREVDLIGDPALLQCTACSCHLVGRCASQPEHTQKSNVPTKLCRLSSLHVRCRLMPSWDADWRRHCGCSRLRRMRISWLRATSGSASSCRLSRCVVPGLYHMARNCHLWLHLCMFWVY